MLLPSDIMDDIDNLNMDLNTAANTLSEKTDENSVKIKGVFNAVYVVITLSLYFLQHLNQHLKYLTLNPSCRRLALIVVAAVMLLLALIGLCMYSL